MSGSFRQPTCIERDDPEFQARQERGLEVLSLHDEGMDAFEATRAEVQAWWAQTFPDATLLWAGGGNILRGGRMWHRWLPETMSQATVLRLFWG